MSTIIEDGGGGGGGGAGGGGGGGGTSRSGEDNSPGTPLMDNIGGMTITRVSSQHQQHHPPPSPLSGCYLLVVLPEPHTPQHRDLILERLGKGFLSWDKDNCHVDLEKELRAIVTQAPEGEEARNGERLIQYATENLVTEVLIHPQTNTLLQCMRNLLASFTKHRHIIHAGYTFGGNGSWILQDGTFSVADFLDAFGEHEVQRVLRAYENSVTVDISCAAIGEWSTSRLSKEACTRCCRVRLNPDEVITGTSSSIVESINNFTNYIGQYLTAQTLDQLMEPSDVVGNIRFTHPTLYVFPGGQGDAALFGINGFNMLVDGGFARKACFWDFARHLDRLDAVLLTRVNNSNVGGMSSVLRKKRETHLYPQIGHFFCNLVERRHLNSPDGDKQADPLTLDLIDIGQDMMLDLRQINLRPHPCYRDPNPINLYHKVGHGTLDMYVLSPGKDSREVREFLTKWHSSDSKLFAGSHKKDSNNLSFPIQNLASICALLVWQPANPEDTITRILFPGSTPQHKIFEGFERLKHLHFLKHPVCTANTLSPSTSLLALKDRPTIKQKLALIDKESTTMKKSSETRREKRDTKQSVETELPSKPSAHTTATPIATRVQQQPKTDVKTRKIVENKKIDNSDYKPVVKRDISKIADYKDEGTKKQSDIMKIKIDNEKTVKEQPRIKSEAKKKDIKPIKANNKIDIAPKAVKSVVDKKTKQQSIITTDKKDSIKASPPTPKKIVNGTATTKTSDYSSIKSTVQSRLTTKLVGKTISALMPAKSAKDANNRKVVEQKNIESAAAAASAAAAVTGSSIKPMIKGKTAERKPISRRDRGPSSPSKTRVAGSPAKSTRSTPTTSVKSDKDGVIKKIKGGERGTTDSSAVSTPSGIEIDSMTKLAADKSLTEKSEDMSLDSIESKVLADLKEEREVVEEIEAVLKKAERIEEARKDDHLEGDDEITAEATDKKDDDMTEEDVTADIEEVPTGSKKKSWRKASQELTEEDEYLIVEKEEIYMEDSVQSGEGEQKHVLDAVESEKKKPIDDTEADISEEKEKSDVPEKKQLRDYDEEDEDEEADEEKEEDEEDEDEEEEEENEEDEEVTSNRAKEQDILTAGHKEQLKEEMKDIIASATEIVQKTDDKDDSGKKDSEDITKEQSSLSPDKFDSSEKKTTDTDPMKPEVDQKDQQILTQEKMEESQERISTVESGATTTAPTLPEDERITLDDIKEVIDEKYIVDEAEKQREISERIKAETFVAPLIAAEPKPDVKTFQVRPAVQGIQREIVKTPDEVADLPVHEEVDPKLYRMEDFEKAKEDKPSSVASQQHQQQEVTPQPPTPSATTAKEQKGVFSFFGKVADKFEKGMDKLTGKSRRDSEKDIDEKSSSKSSSPKEGKARDLPHDEGLEEIIEKSQPEVSQVKVAAITDTAAFLKREIEDVAKNISGDGDTQEKEDEQPPVFETCLVKGHDNGITITQPTGHQLEEDAEDVEALLEEASKKFKTVKDSLRDSLESLEEKIAEEEMVAVQTAHVTQESKTDVVKDTLSEVVEKLVEIKPHTEMEEEDDEVEEEEKEEEDESKEKVIFVIPKSESFDEEDFTKNFKEAVRDVGEVLAGSAGILIDDKPKDVIEIVKIVAEELKKDDFLSHDILFEKDTTLVETDMSKEPIEMVDKVEQEIIKSVVEPLTFDKSPVEIQEEPCVKTTIPKEIVDLTSPIKDSTTDKMEALKICSDLIDVDQQKADVMECGIESVCIKEERLILDHDEEEEEETREIEGSEIVFDRKLSPDKAQIVMVTPDSPPTSPKMTQSHLLPTDIKKQLDDGVPLEEIIKNLFITKKRKITIEIIEYITICRKIPRNKVMEIIDEIIIEKGVARNSVVEADLDTFDLDDENPDDKISEQQDDDTSAIVADEIEEYIDDMILAKGQKITSHLIDEISNTKNIPKRQFIEILEQIIIKRNIPRSSILDISDKELSNLIFTESTEAQQLSPVSESLEMEIEKNIIDEYVTKNRRITPYIFEDICIRFKIPRRTLIGIIEETIKKRNVERSLIIDITDVELLELLGAADDDPMVEDQQPEVDDKLIDGFVSITAKDFAPSSDIVADDFEAVEQEYKIHTTDVLAIGKSVGELDVEKISSHEDDEDDATSDVVEADEKTIAMKVQKELDDITIKHFGETTEQRDIVEMPEIHSDDSHIDRVKRSKDYTSGDKDIDELTTSTVHRMLITASSEDGGHETEVCPTGSIKFTKTITPDDSLKSSPIKTTPDQDSLLIDKESSRSGASTPERDSISGISTSATKDAEKITPEDSLEKSPISATHRDSCNLQDSLVDELDLSKLKRSRTPSVPGDDEEKDIISAKKEKSPSADTKQSISGHDDDLEDNLPELDTKRPSIVSDKTHVTDTAGDKIIEKQLEHLEMKEQDSKSQISEKIDSKVAEAAAVADNQEKFSPIPVDERMDESEKHTLDVDGDEVTKEGLSVEKISTPPSPTASSSSQRKQSIASSVAADDEMDVEKLLDQSKATSCNVIVGEKEHEILVPVERSKSPSIADDKSRSHSIVSEKHDSKDQQQQSHAERSRSSSIAASDKQDVDQLGSLVSDKYHEVSPIDRSKSPSIPQDKSRSASIFSEMHDDKDQQQHEQPHTERSRSSSIAAGDKQDVEKLSLVTDNDDEALSPADRSKSPSIVDDKSRSTSIVGDKHDIKDQQQQPHTDRSRSSSIAASDKEDVHKLASLVSDKDDETLPVDHSKSPSIPEHKSRSASIVGENHDGKDHQQPTERSRSSSVVAGDKMDVEKLGSLVYQKNDESVPVDHSKSPSIPEDKSRSASIISEKHDGKDELQYTDRSRSSSVADKQDVDKLGSLDRYKSPSIPEDKSRSASMASEKHDNKDQQQQPPAERSRSSSVVAGDKMDVKKLDSLVSNKDDEALQVDHQKSPSIPENISRSASITSEKHDGKDEPQHTDRSRSSSVAASDNQDVEKLGSLDRSKSPSIPEDKSRSASIVSEKPDGKGQQSPAVRSRSSSIVADDKMDVKKLGSHVSDKDDEELPVDRSKSPSTPDDKSRPASIVSEKHDVIADGKLDIEKLGRLVYQKDDETLPVDHSKSPSIHEEKSRSASIVSENYDGKDQEPPAERSRSSSVVAGDKMDVKKLDSAVVSDKDDEALPIDHPKSPSIPEDKSRSVSIVSEKHDGKDERQSPHTERSRSSSVAAGDKQDTEKLDSLVSDKDDETLIPVDGSKSPSIVDLKSRSSSIVSDKHDDKDQQQLHDTQPSRSSSIAAGDKQDVSKLGSLVSDKEDETLHVEHSKSPSVPEDESRSPSIVSDKHDDKEQQQLHDTQRSRSSSVAAGDKQEVSKLDSLVSNKEDETLHVEHSKSPSISEDKSRSPSIVSDKHDDKDQEQLHDTQRSRSSSVAAGDKQDVLKLDTLVSDKEDETLHVEHSKSPSIPGDKSRSPSIVSEKHDDKDLQQPQDIQRSRSSSVAAGGKQDALKLDSLVSDKEDETLHVEHSKSPSIPEDKSRSLSITSEKHDDKDQQQPHDTQRSRSSSVAAGDKQDVSKLDSLVIDKEDETLHVEHSKSPSIPEDKSRSPSIISDKHDDKDQQKVHDTQRSRSSSVAAGDNKDVSKLDSLVSNKEDETLHVEHSKSPSISEDKSRSPSIVSDKHDDKEQQQLHDTQRSRSSSVAAGDKQDVSKLESLVIDKEDDTLHVDHAKSPSIPEDKSRSPSIVSNKHDDKDQQQLHDTQRSRSSSVAVGDKHDLEKLDILVSDKDDDTLQVDHSKSPSIAEDKSRSPSIVSEKHDDKYQQQLLDIQRSRSSSLAAGDKHDLEKLDILVSDKDDDMLQVDHSKSPSIQEDKSRTASIVSEKHDAKDDQPTHTERSRSSSIAPGDKQDGEKLDIIVSDKDHAELIPPVDGTKSPSITDDKSRSASIASEKHDDKDQQLPAELDVEKLGSIVCERDDHLKSPSITEDKSRSSSIASEKHDDKDEQQQQQQQQQQQHTDRSRSSSIAADVKHNVGKLDSLVSDKDTEALIPVDRSKSPSIADDKSRSSSIVGEKYDDKDQQQPQHADTSRSPSIATVDKQDVEKLGSVVSDKEKEVSPIDTSKRPSIIDVDHEKLEIVSDKKDDSKKTVDQRSRSSSIVADETKSSSPDSEKGDHRKLSGIAQDDIDEMTVSSSELQKAVVTDIALSKSPSASSVVSEKLQVESAGGADSDISRSATVGDVEKTSRSPSVISEKHDDSQESSAVPSTAASIPVDKFTNEKTDDTKSRRSSSIIGSHEKESLFAVSSRSASIASEKIPDNIVDKAVHDDEQPEAIETLEKAAYLKMVSDGPENNITSDKSRKSSVVSDKHDDILKDSVRRDSSIHHEMDDKESSRISTQDDIKSTDIVDLEDSDKKEKTRTKRETIVDDKTLDARKSSTQESKIDISKESLTKMEYKESEEDEEEEDEVAEGESGTVSSTVFESVMRGESKLHERDAVRALEKLAETIAEKSAESSASKSVNDEITETPKDRSRSHSVFDACEKTPVGRSRTASMYETDSRTEALPFRITEQPEINNDEEMIFTDKDLSDDHHKHETDTIDLISKVEEYIVDKYIVKKIKITEQAVNDIVMLHSIPKYRILELIEAIITKKNVPRDFVVDYPINDDVRRSSREVREGGQIDTIVDDDDEDDVDEDDYDIPAAARRDIQCFIDDEFIRKNKKISSKIIDELVIRNSISRGIIIMIIRDIIDERKIRRFDILEDDINLEDEQEAVDVKEDESNVASMSTGSLQRASMSRNSVSNIGDISEEKRVQVETYIMEECVKKGKKITVLVLEQIITRMSVSKSVLLAVIENIIVTRKMSRTTMVDDAIYDYTETELSAYPSTSPGADAKSSGYSTPETRQYDDKFTKDMSSYSSSDYESPFHKAFVGGMTEIRTTHITTLSGKSTPRVETPDSLVIDDSRGNKMVEETDEHQRVESIISTAEQHQRVSTTTIDTTIVDSAVAFESPGRRVSTDDLTKNQFDYKMPGDTKKSVVNDDTFEEEPEIIKSVKIRREIIEQEDDDTFDEEPEIITSVKVRREIIEQEDDEETNQQGEGTSSISADVKRTITTVTTVTEPDGKVTTKKDVHESTDRLDGQELLEKLLDSRILQHTDDTAGDIDTVKSSRPDSSGGISKIVMENLDRPMSPIIKDFLMENKETPTDKRLDDLRSKSATPDSFRSSEVIRTTITTTRTMSEDGDIITTTKEITETTNDKGEVTILTEKTDVKVEDRIVVGKDIGEKSILPESGDDDDIARSHGSLVGEWDRGGYSSEDRHVYSDDEPPGSPFSTTSQVGYSPQSTYQQFGDGTSGKDSPSRKSIEFSEADMSSSFYGQLPDLPPRVTTIKPSYLDDDSSNQLGSDAIDFSFKKFTVDDTTRKLSSSSGSIDIKKITTDSKEIKGDSDITTKPSSSSSSSSEEKKDSDSKKQDPLKDWGTPLGLPSPKPPRKFNLRTTARTSLSSDNNISPDSLNFDAINDWGEPLRLPSPGPPIDDSTSNKTTPAATPKNERKQPKKIVTENIKNKKVSDSPTKKEKKQNSKDGTKRTAAVQAIYMDLTYVPHHGNSYYSSLEFFKRIRARYYVFSGTEPSREVYDALLDAKKTWEDKHLEVTMIPTYDTDTLGYWVADNEEALAANHIDLSPSASRCTINLQDHETSCSAYRLEF